MSKNDLLKEYAELIGMYDECTRYYDEGILGWIISRIHELRETLEGEELPEPRWLDIA